MTPQSPNQWVLLRTLHVHENTLNGYTELQILGDSNKVCISASSAFSHTVGPTLKPEERLLFVKKTSACDQWCKTDMLYFTNALVIRPSLFLFVLSVTPGNAGVPVGRGMRVEHSDIHIHVGFSNLPPQKLLTAMSNLAPSFVFEVEPVIISPVTC